MKTLKMIFGWIIKIFLLLNNISRLIYFSGKVYFVPLFHLGGIFLQFVLVYKRCLWLYQ